MISERKCVSPRYAINLTLCTIGGLLYIVACLTTVVSTWAAIPVLIQRIWGMVQLQAPLPVDGSQVKVCTFLLVAYFGLLSPLIIRIFRRAPFLRPLMIMGVTFHFGLTLTYFAITISFALGIQSQAVLAAIATVGILLTRALMSWLFNVAPAEVLAFQPRYQASPSGN